MDANDQLSVDFKKNSTELKIAEDIYLRILKKGITQTREDIPCLELSIETENADEIKQITHRLKGDYYNMRIDQLSSLSKQMEEIAKTSMDKEGMKKILLDFKNLFEQLIQKANP